MIYQFKITLRDIQPEIWREVLIHPEMGMDELHFILQTTMYWFGEEPYTFEIGGKRYGEPEDGDEGMEESALFAISDLFTKPGDKALYTYDSVGRWEMDVLLVKIVEEDANLSYPHCIGGARNSPPEECDGPEGYAVLLMALNDPKNTDRARLIEELGGEFDPESFEAEDLNEEFNDPENWEELDDEDDEE